MRHLNWCCCAALVLAACGGNKMSHFDSGAGREGGGGSDSSQPTESCEDGKLNQDETDVDCGGAFCAPCLEGKACKVDTDCKSKACTGGTCRVCKAGTAGCLGNFVRTCNSDEATWTTLATCDPAAGTVCNASTRKCVPSTVIGTATPTGTYYLFSMFTSTNGFKGGFDVDSYVGQVGDSMQSLIYVNRNKQLDVYKVELLDSDKDGKLEPNQHPDNPDAKGPIEERKLTFLQTYTNVTLGSPSTAEIYAKGDRIYFQRADGTTGTNIYEFVFSSGATSLIVPGNPKVPFSVMGYDESSKRWYAGYNSTTRRVYGYYPDGGGWAIEFDYPNLAGSHMDGMEVVPDPKTGIPYVYVSDMTSDFIAQYYRDDTTGKWVQKNVFKYTESSSQSVEGMGFGAFQHFWMTSGAALYEVGGGDLQKFIGLE